MLILVDTTIQVILLNNKPSIISFLFLNNFYHNYDFRET